MILSYKCGSNSLNLNGLWLSYRIFVLRKYTFVIRNRKEFIQITVTQLITLLFRFRSGEGKSLKSCTKQIKRVPSYQIGYTSRTCFLQIKGPKNVCSRLHCFWNCSCGISNNVFSNSHDYYSL